MAAAILSVLILAGCPNDGGTETDPAITGLVITGGTEAVKGTSVQLSAEFTWDQGKANTSATGITWSITEPSNPVGLTRIDSSGKLGVDSSETADTIKVQAYYNNGGNNLSSNILPITVKTPNPNELPTVKSFSIKAFRGEVDITAETLSIKNDNTDSIKFIAYVEVENDLFYKVTWSVVSGTTTGVTLDPLVGQSTTLKVSTDGIPGPIKVKAKVTDTVSQEIDITIEDTDAPPPPPDKTNFKTQANANLLGLYPDTDYESGTNLIAAMNTRADNAISLNFYNPTTSVPNEVPGADGKSYGHLTSTGGVEPEMAWFMYNDHLIVYGYISGGTAKIKFDVAVIDSEGKGWITSYDETYTSPGHKQIPISTLTDGWISNATNLTGHNIYIIVRKLPTAIGEEYDFNSPTNNPATNNKNVVILQ
jgi:hypothetical protein